MTGATLLLLPGRPDAQGTGPLRRAHLWLTALARLGDVRVVSCPLAGGDPGPAVGAPASASVALPRPPFTRTALAELLLVPPAAAYAAGTVPWTAGFWPVLPSLADDVPAALLDGVARVVAFKPQLAVLAVVLARRAGATRLVVDLDDEDEARFLAAGLPARAAHAARIRTLLATWADAVTFANPDDAARVAPATPGRVATVRNAIAWPASPPSHRPDPNRVRLLFVGNLDYLPNRAAAVRAATEVLPVVRAHLGGDVTLDLVGRSSTPLPASVSAAAGVTVHGFVDDLEPLYRAATVFLAPVDEGAGTQLKILDAFAHGVPVVATPTAVAGLGMRDGVHALVADGAQGLAGAVAALAHDAPGAAAMAAAAFAHGRATLSLGAADTDVVAALDGPAGGAWRDLPVSGAGPDASRGPSPAPSGRRDGPLEVFSLGGPATVTFDRRRGGTVRVDPGDGRPPTTVPLAEMDPSPPDDAPVRSRADASRRLAQVLAGDRVALLTGCPRDAAAPALATARVAVALRDLPRYARGMLGRR